MDRYEARINLHGATQRERSVAQLRQNILSKSTSNPSYKSVKLNGEDTHLLINTGTKPYYKEFESIPGQTVLCGDYIEWSNRTWLVYEADADDEIYVDGKMYECNYTQRWQNEDGDLIERPSFVMNASAYNNGETGNSTLTLASNQFMVWMPIDNETLKIRNGKRMFMDNFLDEPACYKLTRPDNVSMKFGEKGCTYYIFTQTETNNEHDKLITLENGNKVWIANYHSPTPPSLPTNPDETTDLSANIIGNTSLKIGFSKTYYVEFKDNDGAVISDIDYKWNIKSNFDVEQMQSDNKIELQVDDENYIDSSFLLQVIVNEIVITEITILVVSIF